MKQISISKFMVLFDNGTFMVIDHKWNRVTMITFDGEYTCSVNKFLDIANGVLEKKKNA